MGLWNRPLVTWCWSKILPFVNLNIAGWPEYQTLVRFLNHHFTLRVACRCRKQNHDCKKQIISAFQILPFKLKFWSFQIVFLWRKILLQFLRKMDETKQEDSKMVNTVNVWNPLDFRQFSYVLFPNNLDFRQCLKSKQKRLDFGSFFLS